MIPRRTLAQTFCDAGLIAVNGVAAKASKDVKAGDEIEIKRRNSLLKVRVSEIPGTKNVSKNSAGGLYHLIEEVRIEDGTGSV